MFPRCSHCTSTRLQLLSATFYRQLVELNETDLRMQWRYWVMHHFYIITWPCKSVWGQFSSSAYCFLPVSSVQQQLFLHFHLATLLWRKLSVKKGINSALLTAWPFKFQKYCRNIPLCNAVPLKVNDSNPSIHPFQSFAWQRSKWRKVCICKLNSLSSRELKGLIIFQATGANK